MNRWTNWYVIFVFGTVVLAVSLFITQFFSMRKSKALSTAQTRLIRLKDEQLARDLKGKDEKIAELNRDADEAKRGIATAQADAAIATAKAAGANERAGVANKAAAEANERAGQLEVKAEQLHKENLELEASLSPRIFKEQVGAGERLSKFAPVNAVIEYLPEMECKHTAELIFTALQNFAKWNILEFRANPNAIEFFDGVIVQVDTAGIVPEDVSRAGRAAEALISELNKTNIKAWRQAAAQNFPIGVVVIRVGMKPNPAAE